MPITNGAPSSDPGVVALVNARGETYCTASIIAPHTVLTAAHCIASVDPMTVRVYDGSYHAVSDARIHPLFDPGGRDIALLTIREAASAMPLALGESDTLQAGAQLRIVGFGLSGPGAGDAGNQREGTARLLSVRTEELVVVPEPSLSCLGDSGGPALHEGTIVGVVSRTDSRCEDHAVYSRVDVAREVLIDPYLAETAPGTAELGDDCFYAEHCGEGICDADAHVCAEDDGSCSIATAESSWIVVVALVLSLRRCSRRDRRTGNRTARRSTSRYPSSRRT